MTLEDKVRGILHNHLNDCVEGDPEGKSAGDVVQDVTTDLMGMLREGKYI